MNAVRCFAGLWISILVSGTGSGIGVVRAQEPHGSGTAGPSERHAAERVTAQFTAERGILVEILGLQQWTPAMLRDSLATRARVRSFRSRRLVAALREQLHFPDAVTWILRGTDSATHVVTAVIELPDSARMRRQTFRGDAGQSVAPWSSLVALARTQLELLMEAVEPPIYARVVGLPPRIPPTLRPDSVEVRRIWATLAAHSTAADADTARQLLVTASHVYDRVAAVAMLSNFPQDDRTWHALVGALLDPDERVRQFAHRVLWTFTTQAPRRVEWRPATADLHAILNGSALFAVPDVLDMLVRTGVASELAGPLLHEGGHAVLLFAGASVPVFRQPSYQFLHRVSGGQDYGGVPQQWKTWIQELRP